MKKFKYQIDGQDWQIYVLEQQEYEMAIDSVSEAESDINIKTITFNGNRINLGTIEHELTHVYIDRCCLRSVDSLQIDQIEEIVCEFIPKYARKILKDSKELKKLIDKYMLEE